MDIAEKYRHYILHISTEQPHSNYLKQKKHPPKGGVRELKICPDCYCTEKCRVWDRKEKYIRIVAAIGCSVVENGRVKWQKWTEMLARGTTKKAKLNCLAWLIFFIYNNYQ